MTEWHLSEDLTHRFALNPRGLDDVTAASVEQHVAACASCQKAVAHTAGPTLETIWAEVEDQIDRPNRPIVRWFSGSAMVRVVAATPALRVGALVALFLVTGLATIAGWAIESADPFLVVAPLVPAALVALSFAPSAEPGGEAVLASPGRGLPVLLLRALTIEVAAFVVLAVAALTLPVDGWASVGWIVPALAFSLVTLAAGATPWSTPTVAGVTASGWIVAVVIAQHLQPRVDIASLALFGPAGQVVWALLGAGAAAAIATQRHVFFQEVYR